MNKGFYIAGVLILSFHICVAMTHHPAPLTDDSFYLNQKTAPSRTDVPRKQINPTQSLKAMIQPLKTQSKVPVIQPGFKQSDIAHFAEDVVMRLFRFNYKNINQHMKAVSIYFAKDTLKQALHTTSFRQLMHDVSKAQLSLTPSMQVNPVIYKQGIQHGHYFWTVKVPVLLQSQGKNIDNSNTLIVTMYIKRSQPHNVIIDKLTMKKY